MNHSRFNCKYKRAARKRSSIMYLL